VSADVRIYCHDCRVRSPSLGNYLKQWEPEKTWGFVRQHIGHHIEANEFALHAICNGSCYDPAHCEGDCYKIEKPC
jgi:hypothetical protein